MKHLASSLATALAVLVATPASAQFTVDVGTGADDVQLQITPTGAGAATLTLTGVKMVHQTDPGIDGVKPMRDVSGKGSVWVVDPVAETGGAMDVCLSGVGRGGYAIVGGKVDKNRVSCAPLADKVVLTATVNGWSEGACVGFTFLALRQGELVKGAWPAHPAGATKQFFKRSGGGTDMVTLVCFDKDGNMVPPTAEQGKTYAGLYLAATAVAKK